VVFGYEVHGGKHAKGERDVEVAAFFEKIRGLQIDQNTARRQRQAHGMKGGSDSFSCFADCLIGKTNDQKIR